MTLWQFFPIAVRLKTTFPLCICELPCPNLNLLTICRSELRSMRRFNAKSVLNHLPRRQLKRPRRNRLSLMSAATRTNEIRRLSPSSRPIALRQKRLCPITAGSAIHLKKSGKHLSSSIEATAISVQALCSAGRLIPYATGTASIRRIDSCRAAAPWTRNRSGKKLPMKTDGASAQELPSGLHKKHCQHSADDRANNLGAVLKH